MSTNLKQFEHFGPAWNRQPVMVFAGQFDTRIETGEDYDTRSLASLFTLEPSDKPKGAGLAFIPSTYNDYDGREHKAQRERGVYVALTGDVDKGDHPIERIETLVRAFAGDAAWLIYSSAHARPGSRRWRIVMPLEEPVGFDVWHDAQNAFYRFMESAGIAMDWALDRAAQPVYLPNVPIKHEKTETPLRGDDDKPLYYERLSSGTNAPGLKLDSGALAAGLGAIARQREADEREREMIRIEAERKRANRPTTSNTEIIGDFNDSVSIETLLESYGYQRCPRHPEDWRSPHQQGETYATRVIGKKWISLSSSDAAANLGDKHAAGCYGDAYDLFVHFEHGGEHKAAFRTLHAERKAGNSAASAVRPPDPPPLLEEDYEPAGPIEAPISQITGEVAGADIRDTPLPLIWYCDVRPLLVGNWIVKRVIPAEAFVTLIGHPGCGKSFLALDIALHIAADRAWFGRKVKSGLVIYLAAEGQRGQMNRVDAWKRHHGIEDELAFALIPVALNLRDKKADVPNLIRTIELAIEASGLELAALIIDTLDRTFGGGDENGEDMGEYVTNSQAIRAHFKTTTITVHHVPKNNPVLIERGHGSLRGAIETSLAVSYDESSKVRTLHCSKQKDAEDGWDMTFKLQSIELGEDEDGEPVTSCVVVDTDGDEGLVRHSGQRLTALQRQIYNELLGSIETNGIPVPRDIPDDRINRHRVGKVVSIKTWRDRWIAVAGSEYKGDAASATFRRAKTELQNLGTIQVVGEHAWATFA